MANMEQWAQVSEYRDGTSLNAETLNIPIGQLGDRTDYLYRKIKDIFSSGTLSSVILTDVKLDDGEWGKPAVGNLVYFNKDNNSFSKAKATMSLYDDFKAADSAFTIGILKNINGDTGNVLIYGKLSLEENSISNYLENGESFRPGRYYLSSNEAGKLTSNPNGPLIYVCTIHGDIKNVGAEKTPTFSNAIAIVTPQFLDIGTSHIHRTAVLTARPAGQKDTSGYPLYDNENSPRLSFGGTWTGDNKVVYKFYFNQTTVDWTAAGVSLYWKENGSGKENSVTFYAPDQEVEISNGLTARLSLPASTKKTAYDLSTVNKREWEPLTFPDAGRGWVGHECYGATEASLTDGATYNVAIKGNIDKEFETINIVYTNKAKKYPIDSISSGTKFTYSGETYEFIKDGEVVSDSSYTPIYLDTYLTGSALRLAKELNGVGDGVVTVLEENNEEKNSVSFIIIGGSALGDDEGASVGEGSVIVYDSSFAVNGIINSPTCYTWNKCGSIYVMPYPELPPAETTFTCELHDEEPNALYDYVIGMDPQISNYWPPVPPKSAALIVNGVEMDNKALIPDSPTVSFGKKTIHWFVDDEGRKPWPEKFTDRNITIDPANDKTEVMHWVRGFQGATGPVTSIQAKSGSPLKVYGYGTTDTANTGDLEIDAELDFKMIDGGTPGYLVPKRSSNGNLIAGPVVERIIGGEGVSVISQSGCPDGQGTVIVALDNGAYRNQFSDIALENAEQAKIGMFPYIRLRGYTGSSVYPSAFTATMRVPTNLPDDKYSLRIFGSVFGESGFTGASQYYASINLTYNILPDFSFASGNMKYMNLKTSLLKPDSARTIDIPFGHYNDSNVREYNGFDPVFLTTFDTSLTDVDDVVSKALGPSIPSVSEFSLQSVTPELRPGYLVGIRISRTATSATGKTPYTGAIGFINLSWALETLN